MDWGQSQSQAESIAEETVWSRSRIRKQDKSRVEGIDAVVVGHTILAEPSWLGNVLYIDTGAFLPEGKLTLLDLKEIAGTIG